MHIKKVELPNDIELLRIRNEYKKNGYAIVSSSSQENTFNLLSLLFKVEKDAIQYNEISIKPGSNLPSNTNSDIPWHQENYECDKRLNILSLRCKKGCNANEPTKLICSKILIDSIENKYSINLDNFKIRFKRNRGSEFTEYFNLVDTINDVKVFRFAMPDYRFRKVEIYDLKNKCIDNKLLEIIINSINEQKVIFFPNVNNKLLILNNLLFLHSRDELANNSERVIERYSITYDE